MSARLREALEYLAEADAKLPIKSRRGRAIQTVAAAARRFLALTETGPDYEAARQKIKWLVECAVHGDNIDAVVSEILVAVDAALADYLTEEE